MSFTEPSCATSKAIPLYQIVGASLDGSDYFVVTGPHENDDGGKKLTRDPLARFGSNTAVTVTPVISNGTSYDFGEGIEKTTPFEGDSIISPSAQLVVTRVGSGNEQLGYSLRLLKATKNSTGYDVDLPQVGRLCLNGAKANVSFDERVVATHHYVSQNDFAELGFSSADDPGFKEYVTKGGANIYIVDLLTGKKARITNVKAGQYAIYPHFRSDGWLYFLVRDAISGKEYVAASDAAIRLP